MKKLFLTSILTMCTIAPAMAVPAQPGDIVDDETMCTIEGIGVDDGTALMEAIWTPITYACTAGEYLYIGLDANNNEVAECRTCLENSYCRGATEADPYTVENHANDIISCSTLENGAYPSSAAGSSINIQCYRACNMNNMGTTFANIPHATAVSGNDYYGNGSDTCGATACEPGWHVKPAVTNSAFVSTIGTGEGLSRASILNDGYFLEIGTNHGQNYYLINDNNTWAVDYGNQGMLIGQARCSSQPGGTWTPNPTTHTTAELGSNGGRNCYCNITGYKPNGGDLQNISSPWVHETYVENALDCEDLCPRSCADSMYNNGAYRAALLSTIDTTLATCEANVIDINWYNLNNIHETNQCTYNEGITLPEQPSDRTGYTFGGWRIKANTNNNNNSGN